MHSLSSYQYAQCGMMAFLATRHDASMRRQETMNLISIFVTRSEKTVF